MILKLELNTLIENGCSLEVATELLKTETTCTYQCNEGNFYVSKENNKVYTSTDFYRKVYFENGSLDFPYNCTELIPDYFNLALIDFMQKQKTVLGVLFDEAKQFEKFKIKEIERIEERITSQKEFLNKMKHHKFKSKENDIEICESYIDFLHTKEYKPQDPKENISNYFDAYSQSIFNGFYKRNEDKSINENYLGNFFDDWNKRTDKFLFERETLKPIYKDLCLFNRRLSMLFDEIIGLFKVVDGYKKTQEPNCHTQLYLKLEAIKRFLSSVEFCCTSINILIENDDKKSAILMKKNCSRHFIQCIDNLKLFEIYIDKTPLKADFENALSNIENSIDYKELQHLTDKPQQVEAVIPDEKYKMQNLFKVGLLFATGQMNEFFTVNNQNETIINVGLSAPKIETQIKNNLDISVNHKYILASLNNYKTGENKNKNIFNNLDMMTKIINHCENQKINIEPFFISRLPPE